MKIGSVVVNRNDGYKDFERGIIHFKTFIESFDDVTKRLDQTVESFEKLKTTRVNKLEKSFEELDEVNKSTDD